MATFTSKYGIGDTVWLSLDRDQVEYMVIEVRFTPIGCNYCITDGNNEKSCYEIELSDEEDKLRKVK